MTDEGTRRLQTLIAQAQRFGQIGEAWLLSSETEDPDESIEGQFLDAGKELMLDLIAYDHWITEEAADWWPAFLKEVVEMFE